MTQKYSFIKSIIGINTYEEFKGYAKRYIPWATIVLVVIFALTNFFYWGFLSSILRLITGTSLVFIAYILGVILLLDFGIDVEMEETRNGSYKMPEIMPKNFTTTKIWGIILIIFAIASIYFSNKYRKHYAFECETFLVDENNGIFHLEDGDEEEEFEYTTKMKGYQIEKLGYTFCESCKEWAEEAEDLYELEGFSRR